MNDFYFMSYNKIVGRASNLSELRNEMQRLSKEDPECVNYHLREGHIVQWLNYVGETRSAGNLAGVGDVFTALKRLDSPTHARGKGMHSGDSKMQVRRKGRPPKEQKPATNQS